MNDFLFFILDDCRLCRFNIEATALQAVAKLITSKRIEFISENIEVVEFNGQYKPDESEVLYVDMQLPQSFNNIPDNTLEINIIDFAGGDKVKTICLYHNGDYYFQCFANRFICKTNRIALRYSDNTYQQLNDPFAFSIEESVHALYHEGKLYFRSYAQAKQIFDLSPYYTEATNEEIDDVFVGDLFAGTDCEWLKNNADSQMRKQITLLKKSGLLDVIDVSKRDFKTWATRAKIPKGVYQTGHIVLPRNKKECKAVLAFLNEDLYQGVFSQKIYQSNSKRVRYSSKKQQ